MIILWLILGGAVVLGGYTYVGYPALLWLRRGRRKVGPLSGEPASWPSITITIPAYNEEASIRATLERVLEVDYPADLRQILVISDYSSDGTDRIVEEFADRGVELLRTPARGGKTAAENAALPLVRGDIVINTDASVRIDGHSVKRLVAAFSDPGVGLASGRDVSVSNGAEPANVGEKGYVNYEMKVRELETKNGGIVGASGCLYAIRTHLHRHQIPPGLSRDFAAALIVREHGFKSVSVWDAVCYVPRVSSMRREYKRKVRTMTRGLQTLHYKRHLLNPLQYGTFSWMLFSHKLCRWLLPWAMVAGLVAAVLLTATTIWAPLLVAGAVVAGLVGWAAWHVPDDKKLPRTVGAVAFFWVGNLAAIHAWLHALHGDLSPTWEPTRRQAR